MTRGSTPWRRSPRRSVSAGHRSTDISPPLPPRQKTEAAPPGSYGGPMMSDSRAVSTAALVTEVAPQLPPAIVAGGLQLLQADRDGGQVGADRPAHELPIMEDADLG